MANYNKNNTTTKDTELKERSVDISTSGVIDTSAIHDDLGDQIEVVDHALTARQLIEHERFMNQFVECRLEESNNPMDEQTVQVCHQGLPQVFIRGLDQKVRRKFLYVLATVKTDAILTKQYTADGESKVKMTVTPVPKYQVTVLDDSREGREWLKRVRAEPV